MTTRVTIATAGDSYHSIDAEVYGEWAAHLAAPDPGWTVTYLPSGRNINQLLRRAVLTETAALQIADRLNRSIDRREMLDWGALKPETKATIRDCIACVLDKVAA